MNTEQALAYFEKEIYALANAEETPDIRLSIEAARCIYLLAPSSFLGVHYAPLIAEQMSAAGVEVFFVDDSLAAKGKRQGEWPVIASQVFVREARNRADAISVNMANSLFAHGYFSQLADRAGVAGLDIIHLLDYLDLPVIYQTAADMRQATLARVDDYLSLARKLEDTLSLETLLAALRLRITLDRKAVLPVLCSLESEYFTPFPAGSVDSFALHEQEVLCDVGAHVGSTIGKFLAATQWQYAAIHAFEPDVENFSALRKGYFSELKNFHAHNVALSDKRATLQFSQTGTMGSRLDSNGNVTVQAVPLDELVDYATFIKMDVEGHETGVLRGARKLISTHRPRLAVTGYHYADDLLDIVKLIHEIEPSYRIRLRHHSLYYYDTIVYAEARS